VTFSWEKPFAIIVNNKKRTAIILFIFIVLIKDAKLIKIKLLPKEMAINLKLNYDFV